MLESGFSLVEAMLSTGGLVFPWVLQLFSVVYFSRGTLPTEKRNCKMAPSWGPSYRALHGFPSACHGLVAGSGDDFGGPHQGQGNGEGAHGRGHAAPWAVLPSFLLFPARPHPKKLPVLWEVELCRI